MEVSGQFSLIGVLPGGINVPELPSNLAKIAMMIEYQQRDDAEKLPVKLAAFPPGGAPSAPIWEVEIEAAAFDAPPYDQIVRDEASSTYPGELVSRQVQVVILNNVHFEREGMLQVRAFRGEEVIPMGGLHIVLGAPPVDEAI